MCVRFPRRDACAACGAGFDRGGFKRKDADLTPRQAGVIILRLAVWSAPSAIIVAVFATDVPWGWWGFFVLLAFFGQMALAAFFWFLEARIKGPPLTPEAFSTWREMKKKLQEID